MSHFCPECCAVCRCPSDDETDETEKELFCEHCAKPTPDEIEAALTPSENDQ